MRRATGRPHLRICLLALGLSGMLVGAASGAIPDRSGVIHGCVDQRGRLNLIDPMTGQICGSNTRPVSWNQRGMAGPSGKGLKSVVVVAIPPDEPALAIYDPKTQELTLRIPRGRDGSDGHDGHEGHDGAGITSVEISALAPDATPTASFDPETGVLSLGIPRGQDGAPGKDGVDGKDGAPGKDGVDGKDGTSVTSVTLNVLAPDASPTSSFDPATGALTLGIPRGRDGVDGAPGAPGAAGLPGKDGKDGTSVTSVTLDVLAPDAQAYANFDGSTGALSLGIPRGRDGTNGVDGTNGTPGKDGKDGLGFTQVGSDYVLTNPNAGGAIKFNAASFDVSAPADKITFPGLTVNGDAKVTGMLDVKDGKFLTLQGTSTSFQAITAGTINTGSLVATVKNFRIDDPLDPKNKWLYHSTIESPAMTNLYDGNVVTDGRGFAVVQLPHYFQALNRDFKYQVTVVGRTFARAIVWKEIANNRFTIRTNEPHVKVSWQVTGVRHDAYALEHPLQVEVPKAPGDRGHVSRR